MASKRKQRALYEVIHERQGGRIALPPEIGGNGAPIRQSLREPAPQAKKSTFWEGRPSARQGQPIEPAPGKQPAATQRPAEQEDHQEPRLAVGPGRVVRVPVGYLILLIPLVLLLFFSGFVLGYYRHKMEADALRRAQLEASSTSLATTLREPALAGNGNVPAAGAGAVEQPLAQTPRANVASMGPIIIRSAADDPRVPGLNYIELVTTTRQAALAAGEFLHIHGIPTALAPVGELFTLVVLRGFEPGELDQPAFQTLERNLRFLGREYKQKHGGASDFPDMYARKYRG